jgi:hypothetical protein
MDQPQAKPRRRRRWLIAGLLLVALSLGTWWYWPRGDARFVGRWQYAREGDPVSVEMDFRSNGFGHVRTATGVTMAFTWTVANEQLVLGRSSSGFSERARDFVASRLLRWLQWTFFTAERPFPIIDSSRDVIRLQ